MDTSLAQILQSLESGLPLLVLHFGATLLLFFIGVAIYVAVTPMHERELLADGNKAAGVVLGGTVVALAIPLAATLATSSALIDIIIWGTVALVFQLLTFLVAIWLFRDLRTMIESGNVAAGTALAGLQIAVALLNAGAMAG
ncbi:DUF350 domain-containing protein [Azospirillum rugosum]|uniref:Membrane protein n=1 Tax=Azospirillum rugosum TaxID=416170 RepID=A0ABS4SHB7_9PROT|nr:DUF350 domain-containing protein [Azospirillum rugosum]MBP2291574.1 putative membrane protein [Azospirillum rugosum]MDQ0524614.1 putative membrane protein [Azospirillum rugosum]